MGDRKPTESDDEDLESIHSRSADSSGHGLRDENTLGSRQTADSGVYESDAFEEESRGDVLGNASEILSEQPRTTGVEKPPEDSNFDYSMDFAEEENAAAPSLQIPSVQDDDLPPRSEGRSSRSIVNDEEDEEDEEQRSAFLDSEADDASQHASRKENESQDRYELEADDFESESAPLPATSGHNVDTISFDERANQLEEKRLIDQRENHEEYVAAHSIRERPRTENGLQNVGSQPLRPPITTANAPAVEIQTEAVVSTKSKSRVVIVREYEQRRDIIEKRDVSTQFTGNHAAIQTELVPDGMHTASERQSIEDDSRGSSPARRGDHVEKIVNPPKQKTVPDLPPPAPSVDATYGLYDPLQLPAPSSLSIYKQQLLAIQQNIQRKKLESERLFREKLAFRYSSLSQTEQVCRLRLPVKFLSHLSYVALLVQFLSANRPRTVPLWQALMRVDPTMTEEKAREVAQLVDTSKSTTNA
ncbi:hypothetical protein PINS_up009030 [Pythium insidiosum]|nr:hypothetical protein PINS_up009030 [Pythium insidiosum]